MRSLRIMLGAAAALAVLATGEVRAQGQQAADEVNRIINELAPTRGAPAERPEYRQRVKRITVEVRPRIAEETAYQQNSIIEERTYVLNYNHTEDFTVHFAFDSFALGPRAREVLDLVGEALSDPRLAGEVYLVAGHTDTAGPADYNQWLSEKRAWAVVQYLVTTWRIEPWRLEPVGFGETLLADPRRGANRLNRRVEFTLIDEYPRPGPVGGAPAGGAPRAGLEDPRPPRHNLDDFGSPRTPVGGEARAAPPAEPERGSGDAIDDTNAAIGN